MTEEGSLPTAPLSNRLIRMVQWYQRAAANRLSPCRFTPSCSSFAVEALQTHGSRRGLWLTTRRLARCRPFGPSGFDPVPEARRPRADPWQPVGREMVESTRSTSL